MSQHSYLVKSMLKSTAVQQAIAGSFSKPGATECVLAKVTLLELTAITEDGTLVTLCEQPVFGSICDIQLLPWNDAFQRASLPAPLVGCDLLVLLSDSSDLAFVGFDRDRQRFVHVVHVDLQNEGFSRTRLPARLAVDPLGRAVAVAAESEHLAVCHVSQTGGAKLMEGVPSNVTSPGLGHVTWDGIVSVAFVRPSDEDVVNGLLKLAVIVRRDDSPGHEVQILFHDTRDNTTHLWARLPSAVNVCPSGDNFLPRLVLAPPSMPDTLLIGRAGDLVALDLTLKGPVAKDTWAFLDRTMSTAGNLLPDRQTEKEGLGFAKSEPGLDALQAAGVRIRTDVRGTGGRNERNGTGFRLGGTEAEVGWELDLRSPDAEKTRVAKRRARGENDRPGDPSDDTFGDWIEDKTEPSESSTVVKEGPSMCSWAWRSDGSDAIVSLVVSFSDGGLQTLEIRRTLGTDGWDLEIVRKGGCDGDTCHASSALAWFGSEYLGAFVKGGDGMVLKLGGRLEMEPVAEVPNAAPIVDFQLGDQASEKQTQLFACCGEGPTASIRTIRPGISAERLLSTAPSYKGVAGLWAMRMSPRDPHHAFLVMAFVSGTRVLSVGLSFDDVTDSVGFQQDATTLACGPITDRHVVQICADAVHLCAPTHRAHPSGMPSDQPYIATWRPLDGARISVGAVGTDRMVVGLSRPSGLVMLGLETRGAPSERHVALVQLQSCRLDAELSCISLQDGVDVSGRSGDVSSPSSEGNDTLRNSRDASRDVSGPSRDVGGRVADASGPSRDVNGPSEDASFRAGSSDGPSSETLTPRRDRKLTSDVRFLSQAGQVCVVGTYRPSVEIFSALPGDGFRLLASIPLEAGTSFQRKGISPLSLSQKSDVLGCSMSPISGCVPESVLLSFFDRGYLLVGLRNGVLARYEWPTGHMERALSDRGTEPIGSTSGRVSVGERPGIGAGLAERIHTAESDGSSGARFNGVSCSANDGPITFKQVGEKRVGSAPVSLRPLPYSDDFWRKSDAPIMNRGASARDPDAPARDKDAFARDPDASTRDPDAFARAPDASARDTDACMPDSDGQTRDLDPGERNPGASLQDPNSSSELSKPSPDNQDCPVSSLLSDVLALSNRPWLLHRSSRGRGRMMTSLVSHPTSVHATAVSCEECPRGIVFITDCCMHLVALDANKKTDVRKLPTPGSSRRILYHPPSKTLLTAGPSRYKSPGFSLQCVHPESGHKLCSHSVLGVASEKFVSEKCVSLSLWTVRDTSYVIVGTARDSRARSEGSPGAVGGIPRESRGRLEGSFGAVGWIPRGGRRDPLERTEGSPRTAGGSLNPETEPHLKGALYVFKLSFPGPGQAQLPAVDLHGSETSDGGASRCLEQGGSEPCAASGSDRIRSDTGDGTETGKAARTGTAARTGKETGEMSGRGTGIGMVAGNGTGNGDGSRHKSGKSGYELDVVGERHLPGPVLTTCQFPIGPHGRTYLIATAGCHVYLFGCGANLAPTFSEPMSRLNVIARGRTRFPIVALAPAIHSPRRSECGLFVGDSSDGVQLYRVAQGFELLRSDNERRDLADVIAAPGDVTSAAVVADRDGGVGVTSSPGVSKSPERNMQVDAWFNLGEAPTRLRAGSSFDDETSASSRNPLPASNVESVPAPGHEALHPGKAVFVSTASGGVHSLTKLPLLEHQFLTLVQQALAKFPATAPLMRNDYAVSRSKGTRAKARSVLEVDFLSQFLDLSEGEQLAVLPAASASLARAYTRLVDGEAGVESEEGSMSADADREHLRELTAVLIENL